MDFQCLASGTPAPTKQWLKDGTPLAGKMNILTTYYTLAFSLDDVPPQIEKGWIKLDITDVHSVYCL